MLCTASDATIYLVLNDNIIHVEKFSQTAVID